MHNAKKEKMIKVIGLTISNDLNHDHLIGNLRDNHIKENKLFRLTIFSMISGIKQVIKQVPASLKHV